MRTNVLIGKPEGKKHSDDLGVDGDDNIQMDVKEIV
jgi:hypothetical protein